MKKLLLASITVLGLGAPLAWSADLPVRPPLPVVVAPSWVGCYVGVAGGGNWGRSSHESTATYAPGGEILAIGPHASIAGPFDVNGWIVGATWGCNLLDAQGWVFGVESDFSWTNKNGSAQDLAPQFNPLYWSETGEKWLSTGRARVGYALIPATLLYVSGGVAFADIDAKVCSPAICFVEAHTRIGWTVGGGVEWAFAQNWSAKLEYLYADFGPSVGVESYFTPPPTGFAARDGGAPVHDHIVRVGVNYKWYWNWAAPVVARY